MINRAIIMVRKNVEKDEGINTRRPSYLIDSALLLFEGKQIEHAYHSLGTSENLADYIVQDAADFGMLLTRGLWVWEGDLIVLPYFEPPNRPQNEVRFQGSWRPATVEDLRETQILIEEW